MIPPSTPGRIRMNPHSAISHVGLLVARYRGRCHWRCRRRLCCPKSPYITVFCVLLLAWPTRSKGELSCRSRCQSGRTVAGRLLGFGRLSIRFARRPDWPTRSRGPQALCHTWRLSSCFDSWPRCCGQNTLATTGRCTASACWPLRWPAHSRRKVCSSSSLDCMRSRSFGAMAAFHLYRELGPELAGRVELSGGRWRATRPAILWAAIAGAGGGTGFLDDSAIGITMGIGNQHTWPADRNDGWSRGLNTDRHQSPLTANERSKCVSCFRSTDHPSFLSAGHVC